LTIGMADHVPADLAVRVPLTAAADSRLWGADAKHAIGSVTGSFTFQETSIHVVSPARHAAAIGTMIFSDRRGL
jgi:hypothetical protein